jgi:putative holliday junction resolvase
MKIVTIDVFMRYMSKANSITSNSRILGLDFGTKQIGIAISDDTNRISCPLACYSRKIIESSRHRSLNTLDQFENMLMNDQRGQKPRKFNHLRAVDSYRKSHPSIEHASQYFSRLVAEHQIGAIVVGYPLREDGSPSKLCDEIIQFMLKLDVASHNTAINDPICTMWDEFGSTATARRYISNFSSKRSVVLKQKDTVAASVILQSFLDFMNHSTANSPT